MDKKKDRKKVKEAKLLARLVLNNDEIINQYFREDYLTFSDFKEIEAIIKSDIPLKTQLIQELAKYLQTPALSESIFDTLIVELTSASELPTGQRLAAIYKALISCSDVTNLQLKDFVAFVYKLSYYNPEVVVCRAPNISTYSKRIHENDLKDAYVYYKKTSNQLNSITSHSTAV